MKKLNEKIKEKVLAKIEEKSKNERNKNGKTDLKIF